MLVDLGLPQLWSFFELWKKLNSVDPKSLPRCSSSMENLTWSLILKAVSCCMSMQPALTKRCTSTQGCGTSLLENLLRGLSKYLAVSIHGLKHTFLTSKLRKGGQSPHFWADKATFFWSLHALLYLLPSYIKGPERIVNEKSLELHTKHVWGKLWCLSTTCRRCGQRGWNLQAARASTVVTWRFWRTTQEGCGTYSTAWSRKPDPERGQVNPFQRVLHKTIFSTPL